MTATVDVNKREGENDCEERSNKVEKTNGCDASKPETLIDAEKGLQPYAPFTLKVKPAYIKPDFRIRPGDWSIQQIQIGSNLNWFK